MVRWPYPRCLHYFYGHFQLQTVSSPEGNIQIAWSLVAYLFCLCPLNSPVAFTLIVSWLVLVSTLASAACPWSVHGHVVLTKHVFSIQEKYQLLSLLRAWIWISESGVPNLEMPIWVCLKIGYIPNCSHLTGIMISKTIGFRGTIFSDTPIWVSNQSRMLLVDIWVWAHAGINHADSQLNVSICNIAQSCKLKWHTNLGRPYTSIGVECRARNLGSGSMGCIYRIYIIWYINYNIL